MLSYALFVRNDIAVTINHAINRQRQKFDKVLVKVVTAFCHCRAEYHLFAIAQWV